RLVERRDADAAVLGVRPAAAEKVRTAGEAERLRASLRRLVRLDQVLSLQDPDRRRRHADVHGSAAAGELLAAFAVAVAETVRRLGELELDAAAEATSVERPHVVAVRAEHKRSVVPSAITGEPRGQVLHFVIP